MADLDNRINSDIGTLKKYRGDLFSEYCTKIFKTKFLRYVNELLFEMVKNSYRIYIWAGQLPHNCKMRYLHSDKCIMIERLGLW